MALFIHRRRTVVDSRIAQAACSFVETLECREFLSAGDLLDAAVGPVAMTDAIHATAAAEAAHETRVILVTGSDRYNDDETKTLTATVTTVDPEAPTPTGSVAFFTTADKDLRGVYPVVSVPDGSGGTTTGYLLGIAELDETGAATLTLEDMPIGQHSIVAVYLGAGAPITPQSTAGLSSFTATKTAKTLIENPTSSKTIRNSVVVNTNDKHFRIAFGRIKARDAAPDSFHTVPATGVHLLQEEHEADVTVAESYFGPVDVPLRIDVTAKKLSVDDDGVTRFYYAYNYRITPVGVPASLTDVNADFQGSASAAADMHVVVKTDLKVVSHGATTVTNPPTITASVIRPDGTLLSAAWPTPATRGGIQTASAGLKPLGTTSAIASTASDVLAAEPEDDVPVIGDRTSVTAGELPPRRMPTGKVIFFDGDVRIGRGFLDADGNATFLPASRSLAFGEHDLRAVYKGDANYTRTPSGSESNFAEVNLTRTETEISIAFSDTLITAGDKWQLYADVKTKVPDLVKPTGRVRFFVDGEIVGTINLGSTQKLEHVFPAGEHSIRAKYIGDADTLKSTVNLGPITANKVQSFLAVFPNAFPNVNNEPVKMSSYVRTGAEKLLVPEGQLTLKEIGGDNDGRVVATADVFEPFQFDFDFEADEKYHFKAFYDGDDNTLASETGEFILFLKDGEIVFDLPAA